LRYRKKADAKEAEDRREKGNEIIRKKVDPLVMKAESSRGKAVEKISVLMKRGQVVDGEDVKYLINFGL
jgi:molybdopterin biosynthesis enzyme